MHRIPARPNLIWLGHALETDVVTVRVVQRPALDVPRSIMHSLSFKQLRQEPLLPPLSRKTDWEVRPNTRILLWRLLFLGNNRAHLS